MADLNVYQELREEISNWANSDEGKKNKWTEWLLFTPDLLHLLNKLITDNRVDAKEKIKLSTAITYFKSPIDMIPEAVHGVVGFVDDIAVAAYVLNSVVDNTEAGIVQSHWAGEGDILDVIKQILNVADEMVGSEFWKIIKGTVNIE